MAAFQTDVLDLAHLLAYSLVAIGLVCILLLTATLITTGLRR